MWRLVRKVEQALTGIETIIAVSGMITMLVLSLIQVVARNFFDTGYPLADTLVRYLVLLVSFSGAILAVKAGRHIHIDVAQSWLPPHWLPRIAQGCNLVAALVCAVFTWAASRFWALEWEFAPPNEKWLAAMALILPVSFALLTLHFLARLVPPPSPEEAPGLK
jgi:TRAP-type C4-dicarboxylate transport system permease small subunit